MFGDDFEVQRSFYPSRQPGHLHNRCNPASSFNQPHWPLVAPAAQGRLCSFSCSRTRRSSTPRKQVPGGLVPSRQNYWDPLPPKRQPSPASTWDRVLAADCSVEGFPDTFAQAQLYPQGAWRGCRDVPKFPFPGLAPNSTAFTSEIHHLPPHPPAFCPPCQRTGCLRRHLRETKWGTSFHSHFPFPIP